MPAIPLGPGKLKLCRFRSVGGAFSSRQQMRIPGWTHLLDAEGNFVYFSENTSLNDAIAKAKADGHDTSELEERIKNPANWGFSLLPQGTKQ